jgi:hypothetical protein
MTGVPHSGHEARPTNSICMSWRSGDFQSGSLFRNTGPIILAPRFTTDDSRFGGKSALFWLQSFHGSPRFDILKKLNYCQNQSFITKESENPRSIHLSAPNIAAQFSVIRLMDPRNGSRYYQERIAKFLHEAARVRQRSHQALDNYGENKNENVLDYFFIVFITYFR